MDEVGRGLRPAAVPVPRWSRRGHALASAERLSQSGLGDTVVRSPSCRKAWNDSTELSP